MHTRFLIGCLLLTVIIRQIFSWAPISSKTEMSITKPKLVISSAVNKLVCVRKPGPIADVAIRKAAPVSAAAGRSGPGRADGNAVLF